MDTRLLTLLLLVLGLCGDATSKVSASVIQVGGAPTGPGEGGWVIGVYSTWTPPPVHVGDQLSFEYAEGDGHVHNVLRLKDKAAFDSCNFEDATYLGIGNVTTDPLPTTGTFYYACSIGGGAHCENNQKMVIQVT